MTLNELVNRTIYTPFPELWESQSRRASGCRSTSITSEEAAARRRNAAAIIQEIWIFQRKAQDENLAAGPVTKTRKNSSGCRGMSTASVLMSQFYAAKPTPRCALLRYAHSNDIADIRRHQRISRRAWIYFKELQSKRSRRIAMPIRCRRRNGAFPSPVGASGQRRIITGLSYCPSTRRKLADFQHQVADINQARSQPPNDADIKPLPKARSPCWTSRRKLMK